MPKEVAVGHYMLKVAHPDYEPYQTAFSVRDAETTKVDINLRARPANFELTGVPAGLKYTLRLNNREYTEAPREIPADIPSRPQAPNDEAAYRTLVLDNGLRVILLSDPKLNKSSASLAVGVGSYSDPANRQGLAHFLEHMLFLGTDKYPDAAEYERFVTEHGGSRNAYTAFEETNYFFDINPQFLPEALDRFAQFFIAPRFDAQYVERERNAFNSERVNELEMELPRPTLLPRPALLVREDLRHQFQEILMRGTGNPPPRELAPPGPPPPPPPPACSIRFRPSGSE